MDDVTQWCIEEAVIERQRLLEAPGPSTVTTTEFSQVDDALGAALDQAAQWHREHR